MIERAADIERKVDATIAAVARRGMLPDDVELARARARAALIQFRAIRRIQLRRDANLAADLGGEAADYTVGAFEPDPEVGGG